MRIHDRPDNREIPKDYTLQQQTITSENTSHITPNTYIFTEKDIAAGDSRVAVFGEARSALYEAMKRDARKRDRRKKWEPYVRKTIPSTYDLTHDGLPILMISRTNRSCRPHK